MAGQLLAPHTTAATTTRRSSTAECNTNAYGRTTAQELVGEGHQAAWADIVIHCGGEQGRVRAKWMRGSGSGRHRGRRGSLRENWRPSPPGGLRLPRRMPCSMSLSEKKCPPIRYVTRLKNRCRWISEPGGPTSTYAWITTRTPRPPPHQPPATTAQTSQSAACMARGTQTEEDVKTDDPF